MYIIFNFSSNWMRWCIFMCHYLTIFWCQCSHNIPIRVFCTIKLLVFEISTPECPNPAAPPRWVMHSHDLHLSHQGCSWNWGRPEGRKEEKKSFFPSHRGQSRDRDVSGQSLPVTTDHYCPKDGGVGGRLWSMHLWWGGGSRGRVGEKFEFLQSYVTSAEGLTKRHFDGSNMDWELITASPWWL